VTAFELPDGLVIHTVNGEPVEGIQALQAQHPGRTDWSDCRPAPPDAAPTHLAPWEEVSMDD